MYGTRLNEKLTKLHDTLTMITVAFINLNKETVRKTYRRFWSRLEALVEANGFFFE